MATKRKAFANPALSAFISTEEPAREEPQAKPVTATPAGTSKQSVKEVIVYMKPETKSKHVHTLLKPTNHEKAKSRAKDMGISLNEYLNWLIEQDA